MSLTGTNMQNSCFPGFEGLKKSAGPIRFRKKLINKQEGIIQISRELLQPWTSDRFNSALRRAVILSSEHQWKAQLYYSGEK